MSTRNTHRFSIVLSLMAVLILALTAGGAPLAAQRASGESQPRDAAATDEDFRSRPVMFIENAGQWDKRSASQIVDENEADRALVSSKSWNVELVGQVGGGTYAIAVQGNYAYLGVGPRLVVLNIADPAHPTAISQTSVLPDKLADVVVVGSYAYVADLQGGLRVINVANAAAPVEVGHCETPRSAHDVAIMGSYAYVADGSSGLRVIHIADPTAPVEVGHHDTPGEALGVAVAGNYAYVADQQGGLRVINVANPAAPTEVSFRRTFRAMAVAVANGYAYVADEFNGLRVFRVTNPFAPVEVGQVTGVNAYDLVLGTGYAYVADEMRLVVVNIANPVSPIVVGSWRAPTYGLDFRLHVALAGDHALMARADSGLHVISVADPTRPTETSTYKSFLPQDNLAVANNRAFAVNGNHYPRFRMVDVSQPNKITTVGVCCEDTINLDVAAAGNYAYIAADYGGFRVVDTSNPASPVAIGQYGNFWAADVEVRGRYAYVWGDGFRVFDVSAPSTPVLVGVLTGSGVWGAGIYFGHVAMTDSHAYAVPGHSDELEVYAITNPRAPSLIAQVRLPYRPEQVAISGNHLFIAADTSGLRTMDVSNPRSPVEVASWQVPGGREGSSSFRQPSIHWRRRKRTSSHGYLQSARTH